MLLSPQRQPIDISLQRTNAGPLVEQIRGALRSAIVDGRLQPGDRLPSWLDLASQLGVARGTVKSAYDKLADEALVVSAGAAGTRVAEALARPPQPPAIVIRRPLEGWTRGYDLRPLPFQMGVPAQDAFPAKQWSRLRARIVRDHALSVGQPDPRGALRLRAKIAGYLALTRGIRCLPDQIIVTSGYRNGLALAIRTLGLRGQSVWMEEPGYPVTRKGLELDGMVVIRAPVDSEGIDVNRAIELCPDAALAVVTPGQQAPTGVMLSSERRRALLDWAHANGSWIIEDDYLSDLQLSGRAAPALAAEDAQGRVIHIGSFGKTLSPSLGLGFLVAPLALAERFGEVTACLQPAPDAATQMALAEFMGDGCYFRHLRQMKRLYGERREVLLACLGSDAFALRKSGVALIVDLPDGADDVAIARHALDLGVAPTPLSVWYGDPKAASRGLLLSVTNLRSGVTAKACDALRTAIRAGL
jgi:GntR family transcriptional regulator/MocR family aminotransferase